MNSIENEVRLIGRYGADWELKQFEGDKCVATTSFATSSKYKGEEKTEWHRLVAWNKTAEVLSQYTKKGDEMAISGKITYRKWEDKDGNKRSTTEIIVNSFKFIGSKEVEQKISQPIKVAALDKSNQDDLPF